MESGKRLDANDIGKMFDANPDGAGICYPLNDRVIIRKGFFTLPELLAAYFAAPVDVPLIVHCRIATSGGIDEKTCHPFAVAKSIKKTNKRSCNIAFAHNGILSGLGSKFASDTQEYVSRVVAPLVHKSGARYLYQMAYVMDIIAATSQDCRFAFMDALGDVQLIGEWHDYHGAKVSNLSFTSTYTKWIKKPKGYTPTNAPRFEACRKCSDYDYCDAWGAVCATAQEAKWYQEYQYNDEYIEPSWYGVGGEE